MISCWCLKVSDQVGFNIPPDTFGDDVALKGSVYVNASFATTVTDYKYFVTLSVKLYGENNCGVSISTRFSLRLLYPFKIISINSTGHYCLRIFAYVPVTGVLEILQ